MIIFVLTVVFIAVFFICSSFVGIETVFNKTYAAFHIDPASAVAHFSYYEKKYPGKYKRTPVEFASGKNTLRGYIYGEENQRALIVFSHGIWSGPEDYLTLILWLTDHGYRVFTYNNTAYNDSDGTTAKGLPQSALDLHAALTYIEQNQELKDLPVLLLGHSWGAYAVTAVLNFDHKIAGVCSMAGFNDPLEISLETSSHMLGKTLTAVEKPWIAAINKARFGQYARLTAVNGINRAQIPVLLIHGENDDFIGYTHSAIMAKKTQIHNARVEYLPLTEKGRSEHNTFFGSFEAQKLYKEIDTAYRKLQTKYPKGKVPDEEKKNFYQQVDLDKTSEPNEELYEKIADFYERVLTAEE